MRAMLAMTLRPSFSYAGKDRQNNTHLLEIASNLLWTFIFRLAAVQRQFIPHILLTPPARTGEQPCNRSTAIIENNHTNVMSCDHSR